MGNYDHPFPTGKEPQLQLNANLLVIASEYYACDLVLEMLEGAFSDISVMRQDADALIAMDALDSASVLVLEVDPGDRLSMERLSSVRSSNPGIALIAAIKNPSVGLVRTLIKQGVADVVSLPFETAEVLQTALEVISNHRPSSKLAVKLAPMISIASSTSGCGATSIATHLAGELAKHDIAGKGVVIVDLDMQFGSVSEYLGSQGRGTIADLLDAGPRLDADLIRSILRSSSDHVGIIAAPFDIMPLETIDTDQILRILQILRQQFSYVVLDLPADWTNWTLSSALASDEVLLIVELSIDSLRQAKRRMDLFELVGIDRKNVQIVLNRVKRRLFPTITADDAEATLGQPPLASIALDEPLVSTAQDQGELVTRMQRKSHFASDIENLAQLLRDGPLSGGKR